MKNSFLFSKFISLGKTTFIKARVSEWEREKGFLTIKILCMHMNREKEEEEERSLIMSKNFLILYTQNALDVETDSIFWPPSLLSIWCSSFSLSLSLTGNKNTRSKDFNGFAYLTTYRRHLMLPLVFILNGDSYVKSVIGDFIKF